MGPRRDEDIDLPKAAEDLAARRARIAHTALRAVLYLGLLAYVPSAWLCLRTGAFAILALDTLAYLAIADAEESLRLLTRPDSGVELVLTDLKMPGLTGLELAASLRTLVPDTPIILMSGLVDDDLRSRATAVGIHAVVAKPFEIHPLLEVVAAALESGGTPIMPSTPQSFPLGRPVADFTADGAATSAHA